MNVGADLASVSLFPELIRRSPAAVAASGHDAALSNDVSPDVAFVRQTAAYGRRGDVVVGLSTSGTPSPRWIASTIHSWYQLIPWFGFSGPMTLYHTLWELTLNELTTGKRDPARAERREVARGVGDHD